MSLRLRWAKNQRTNGPVKRSPDIWAKHKIKFGSKWPNNFWEKPVLIFKCKWPWAKVKKWPWPSILTYVHYLNRFQVTGCNSSEKSKVFTFFYRKPLVTKFDLAIKQVKVNPGPRSRNDLDLQYSHIFIIPIGFWSQATKVLKNQQFSLFLQISLCYQIWHCHKIGQGQPKVIIWTNYDGQESSMWHTKFRGNQSTGSGEEDFWRVFTI